MSGDDEQRVVDPDADHHQLGELGRHLRHVHDVGEDADQAEPAGQRDGGAGQRQHDRAGGAEHDRQDDQRGQEAEQLRQVAAAARAEAGERVAGELRPRAWTS